MWITLSHIVQAGLAVITGMLSWGSSAQTDRLPILFDELVASSVDVIITFGYPAALVAKQKGTFPTVASGAGDPVSCGRSCETAPTSRTCCCQRPTVARACYDAPTSTSSRSFPGPSPLSTACRTALPDVRVWPISSPRSTWPGG